MKNGLICITSAAHLALIEELTALARAYALEQTVDFTGVRQQLHNIEDSTDGQINIPATELEMVNRLIEAAATQAAPNLTLLRASTYVWHWTQNSGSLAA